MTKMQECTNTKVGLKAQEQRQCSSSIPQPHHTTHLRQGVHLNLAQVDVYLATLAKQKACT